jgi:hypothetical protein
MTNQSRTFCYALMAAAMLATTAPAFAAGDGGSPSSTSGTATPSGNITNPASTSSSPKAYRRRTAMNTSGSKTTRLSPGAGTAGTPNSHPAMAPTNAQQTNNPDAGK